MAHFNNSNPITNGELKFYNSIKNSIKTIFDIGCRSDTLFNNFSGEVHYFEPIKKFIDKLQLQKNSHSKSFYNNIGLSDIQSETYYYPKYQSFIDRYKSCKYSDAHNKILLKTIRADEYIEQNNIEEIDFVKIDTEGYEFKVLKGFGDKIYNVKIIQFEYGGTYIDNEIKLLDIINYLKEKGFDNFSYLSPNGLVKITNLDDHYNYCNIVCFNKKI